MTPAGEQTDSETPDELVRAVGKLETLLQDSEELERPLLAILEHRLRRGPNEDTFGSLLQALTDYLGDEEGRGLIALLVAELDDPAYEELTKTLPRVSGIRRTAKAIYGRDIEDSFRLWGERRDDWRTATREIYHDVRSRDYVVRLQIEKFNGESMLIEGDPGSLLRLARRIVTVLLEIPDTDAFSGDQAAKATNELVEQVERLSARSRATVAEGEPVQEQSADTAAEGGMTRDTEPAGDA